MRKPFFQSKTFWFAVSGQLLVVAALVLNKVLNLGYTTTDMAAFFGAITTIAVGFIGAEKFRDAKIVSAQINADAYTYGKPLLTVLELISKQNPKGAELVGQVKELIAQDSDLKAKLDPTNGTK
jgi:hypothetical protein